MNTDTGSKRVVEIQFKEDIYAAIETSAEADDLPVATWCRLRLIEACRESARTRRLSTGSDAEEMRRRREERYEKQQAAEIERERLKKVRECKAAVKGYEMIRPELYKRARALLVPHFKPQGLPPEVRNYMQVLPLEFYLADGWREVMPTRISVWNGMHMLSFRREAGDTDACPEDMQWVAGYEPLMLCESAYYKVQFLQRYKTPVPAGPGSILDRVGSVFKARASAEIFGFKMRASPDEPGTRLWQDSLGMWHSCEGLAEEALRDAVRRREKDIAEMPEDMRTKMREMAMAEGL